MTLINPGRKPHMKSALPIINHYTTSDALINILKNKSLWLSMHQYMNDPIEMLGCNKVIISCMNTLYLRDELPGSDEERRTIVEAAADFFEKHHR